MVLVWVRRGWCRMSCGRGSSRCCRCVRRAGRAEAVAGSAGVAGHLVRALHRDRVGGPAAGAGLRLGHDVLAAVAGLAGGGVFDRLHEVLLAELNAAAAIDWSRACVDASHVRAKRGPDTGPEPGRPGQDRLQAPCDLRRRGIPLAVRLTGGNRNDITQLLPLVGAIPPVRGRRGRPAANLTCSWPTGLRPRHLPRCAAAARDPPVDQPPRHPRQRPGSTVGRRTDPRPAAPVPPPGHPVGTPHRHPPRPPHPRHQHHLLAPTPQPNTLGALTPDTVVRIAQAAPSDRNLLLRLLHTAAPAAATQHIVDVFVALGPPYNNVDHSGAEFNVDYDGLHEALLTRLQNEDICTFKKKRGKNLYSVNTT